MSRLVALTFDAPGEAGQARAALRDLERRGSLGLNDVAVVVKDAGGQVSVRHDAPSVVAGAIVGGVMGLGLMFMFPIIGIFFGAGAGALISRLFAGRRLDADMVADVSTALEPGSSALLVLLRTGDVQALAAAAAHPSRPRLPDHPPPSARGFAAAGAGVGVADGRSVRKYVLLDVTWGLHPPRSDVHRLHVLMLVNSHHNRLLPWRGSCSRRWLSGARAAGWAGSLLIAQSGQWCYDSVQEPRSRPCSAEAGQWSDRSSRPDNLILPRLKPDAETTWPVLHYGPGFDRVAE